MQALVISYMSLVHEPLCRNSATILSCPVSLYSRRQRSNVVLALEYPCTHDAHLLNWPVFGGDFHETHPLH